MMKIACTGFVSQQAGSVASANALLLGGLLERGVEVDFFSKPSFVDPRPVVGDRKGFRFVPVVNAWSDGFRCKVQGVPGLGALAGRNDAACYNRLLVRRVCKEQASRGYDAVLWMGDYAHGTVPGVPTVSFVQGPPGTDARSVLARFAEIQDLAGTAAAWRWRVLAGLRLSRLGLPAFRQTDHFIVGSGQSKRTLHKVYGIAEGKISTMPYPIDLTLFKASSQLSDLHSQSTLRVLWLGRIVPRKRLDVFLSGAAEAIRNGLDVILTVVGGLGFIPGYEKMMTRFPYLERLEWKQTVPRDEVPDLLRKHDVLAQPSDEENFGSSVAEAQACGLPVIVGRTNGNADYLCGKDIHLADDRPETFAKALLEMARRKRNDGLRWKDAAESRTVAERCFSLEQVVDQLLTLMKNVILKA